MAMSFAIEQIMNNARCSEVSPTPELMRGFHIFLHSVDYSFGMNHICLCHNQQGLCLPRPCVCSKRAGGQSYSLVPFTPCRVRDEEGGLGSGFPSGRAHPCAG